MCSDNVEEVTAMIAHELSDVTKTDCDSSVEIRAVVIRSVLGIMDGYEPRLSYQERCAVLDFVEKDFGICM